MREIDRNLIRAGFAVLLFMLIIVGASLGGCVKAQNTWDCAKAGTLC